MEKYFVIGIDPQTGKHVLLSSRDFFTYETAFAYARSCALGYQAFVVRTV